MHGKVLGIVIVAVALATAIRARYAGDVQVAGDGQTIAL